MFILSLRDSLRFLASSSTSSSEWIRMGAGRDSGQRLDTDQAWLLAPSSSPLLSPSSLTSSRSRETSALLYESCV